MRCAMRRPTWNALRRRPGVDTSGGKVIAGRGLVAAAFRQRTSRLGDPQLHTHVLVANLVEGDDGRRSALDGRLLYALAKTASVLYEACLRAEVTARLGVEWTPLVNGLAQAANPSSPPPVAHSSSVPSIHRHRLFGP